MRKYNVGPDGILFNVKSQMEAIAFYEKNESLLQILADEHKQVTIAWQGCKSGLKKFAKDYPTFCQAADNIIGEVDRISFTDDAVNVYCSKAIADRLLETCPKCALFALSFGKDWFKIYFDGSRPPYEIPSQFANMLETTLEDIMTTTVTGLVTTRRIEGVEPPKLNTNLDLTQFYLSPYPVYITSLEDETLLFCNPAALRSQGRKPKDMHLMNGYTLNFEDELQARNRHLNKSLEINEYEFQALRWHQDEDGIWRRAKMDFCSNIKKVTFLDVQCRAGVILEAIPV